MAARTAVVAGAVVRMEVVEAAVTSVEDLGAEGRMPGLRVRRLEAVRTGAALAPAAPTTAADIGGIRFIAERPRAGGVPTSRVVTEIQERTEAPNILRRGTTLGRSRQRLRDMHRQR